MGKPVSSLFLFIIIILSLSCLVGAASLKIGVVDMETILARSDAGLVINEGLARFVENTKMNLARQQQEWEEGHTRLRQEVETAEQEEAWHHAAESWELEWQRLLTEAQRQIEIRREEYRQVLLQDVAQLLQLMAAEDGYDLILDAKNVHYYAPLVDLTWEVIRKYNRVFAQASQKMAADGE